MAGKILGVMGGLGPLATSRFLELVVNMTDARRDQDNVDMIIYNFPSIPDRTGYILGSNLRSPLPGLLSVGRALVRQGVSCIAIPCITAHYFYEELEEELRSPILHAVRDTVAHLKDHGVGSAGILATEGTISSGIFLKELREAGIRPVVPSREAQEEITHLIYRNIKAGLPPEMDRFHRAEQELRSRGAETILLGCTELSCLKGDHPLGPGYLDAMEVLAQRSVMACGKKLKPGYDHLITK